MSVIFETEQLLKLYMSVVLCQQMINIACEKEKLELLEQQHRATAEELEACTDKDEAELLRQRSMDEQDAVDNQKFLVDNLEFQQLEVTENTSITQHFTS